MKKNVKRNGSKCTATEAEKAYILKHYKTKPSKRIAADIGRSFTFVRGVLRRMGLAVPPEAIARFREESQLKKGLTPPNKGKKAEEFMSPETLRKFRQNEFKKGHLPHNHKPTGSERTRNSDGYLLVKVAEPNVWRFKHRIVWEEHFGEVPDDMMVAFKNGDKTDVRIENLQLTCKVENMIKNSVHDFHQAEIQPRVLLSKIKNKIKEIENGEK